MVRKNEKAWGKLVSLVSVLVIVGLILMQVPPGVVSAKTPRVGFGVQMALAQPDYLPVFNTALGQNALLPDDTSDRTITGSVRVAGAILSVMDGDGVTTEVLTDGTGAYSIQVPYDWSGTVTPSLDGYVFTPASRTYPDVLDLGTTLQDYVATSTQPLVISGNVGIECAVLSYSDGELKTIRADGEGNYSIVVSENWSGNVTPSCDGYSFDPASREYTSVGGNLANEDYTATSIPNLDYITGNVGVGGATLSVTNKDGVTTTFTADAVTGEYSYEIPEDEMYWSGAIMPSLNGYVFTPASRFYPASFDPGSTEQDYVATTTQPLVISGNTGVAYAQLGYDDGGLKTVFADGAGDYSLVVSKNWSGSVTPSRDGYTFDPISHAYTEVATGLTGVNFVAVKDLVTYSITGIAGAAGAAISITNGIDFSTSATADAAGLFSVADLPPGSYTLTPTHADYTFTPTSQVVDLVDANLSNINFSGHLIPTISDLAPSTAKVGDPTLTSLTVTGANFVTGSVVKWGETLLDTTLVSNTSLTAAVTPDLLTVAGAVPITVVNPELEGGISAAVPFIVGNPAPQIYALAPNSAMTHLLTDLGLMLEVTGANFVTGSKVRWNGENLDTTYLSPTQLRVEVPASKLTEPLQVPVTVENPSPGGGVSGELIFNVEGFLPADGQKLATTKVNFNWADVPGANAYQLQMSRYNNFSNLIINGVVYSSQYYYRRSLTNGATYYWRYRSRVSGVWSSWTPTYKFYSLNPPLAPVVMTPNGYPTNQSEALLSWSESKNAVKYQVQISTSYRFTSNLQDVITPEGATTFTTTALADGSYYWRVRGIDTVDVRGSWSRYRSFRVDTVPPAAPQLALPVDGVFVNNPTPTLTVVPFSDAAKYCFQVADNLLFDPVLVNPACETSTTTPIWVVPVDAQLGYQSYYWRALAFDAAGNSTVSLAPRVLNITRMLTPADSSYSSNLTPEFIWMSQETAVGYHLQVSTTPDFVPETEIVIDELLDTTTYIPAAALSYGTYYWRLAVDVDTGAGSGNWMPVQRFTLSPLPATPALVTPANGVLINDKTPLLEWSVEEAPVFEIVAYDMQISADAAFSRIVQSQRITGESPQEASELAVDGSYYWRVRAVNELSAPSEWSAPFSFILDSTPVKAPLYYSPTSGAVTTTTIPKLIVRNVSGASLYHFQVSAQPTFAEPLLVDQLVRPGRTTASYTLSVTEALPFGTVYWRAATVDKAGNEAWADPRLLIVNILNTPKSATTITDQTPTFSWSAAEGVLSYELQVASTADFENGSIIITELFTNSTNFTPVTLLAPGKYYWRMRTDTGAGFSENWTPVYSLIVSLVRPSAPNLMEPASAFYSNDATPKLRWVETFRVYALQLRIKDRLVQVYLPPDYATSGKSYPVLYLNDGQSKFGSGYDVDDALERLYESGQIEGIIAVAIPYSANRSDEFNPWVNNYMNVWYPGTTVRSRGGEGDEYVDFVVDTLKPIVDSRYRTLPDREHTAIGAGSMGGFISLYAALREPEVFSKVMALSPAVWFGEGGGAWLSNNHLINYIKEHPVPNDTKFFLYIGTNEWEGVREGVPGMTYPQIWVSGTGAVKSAILSANPNCEVNYVVNPGGIHAHVSWHWWIDDAVTWLFSDTSELPLSAPNSDMVDEDHHEIQISTSRRFSFIAYTGYSLDGQMSYDSASLEDGRYYWRVRAINELGSAGAWSSSRYLYIDTVPPDQPQLYTPGINGFTYDTTPALAVKPVSGAYQYCFQVADSAAFDNKLVNPECAILSTRTTWSVPSTNMLPYGDKNYWRAVAYDRAGNVSDSSEVRQLTVSIMRSPVDHSNTTNTRPTFVWATVAGGQKYHLQVSTDSTFSDDTLTLNVERNPSTYYLQPIPLTAGKYFWRMRVMIGGSYGEWMPVQTFTVSPLPPAPILNAPGSGSLTNDRTPLLSWNPVVDPNRPISGYQVQVSKSSRFTSAIIEDVMAMNSHESAAITDDGRYYWRVRAINDLGVTGGWSSARSFVIDTTPPKIPSLVIPLDNATIHGLPFYYWRSDSSAKYYQFEFATDAGFTKIEYRTGELALTYHILPGQKPGKYYWHSRSRDVAGNWSEWSEARLVTIVP